MQVAGPVDSNLHFLPWRSISGVSGFRLNGNMVALLHTTALHVWSEQPGRPYLVVFHDWHGHLCSTLREAQVLLGVKAALTMPKRPQQSTAQRVYSKSCW
jgi:hypothetical protein